MKKQSDALLNIFQMIIKTINELSQTSKHQIFYDPKIE